MGRRNRKRAQTNLARRLKGGNKKMYHDKKVIRSHVAEEYKNVNEKVTKAAEEMKNQPGLITIDEQMTFDQIKNLLSQDEAKKDRLRINLDEKMFLQPLLKKHGEDYVRMANDIKLNKMQWNANQIKKKHDEYKKFLTMEAAS